ncbi:hypothetical protein LINPERPRIM_LOCUS28057 [Linum perenne]
MQDKATIGREWEDCPASSAQHHPPGPNGCKFPWSVGPAGRFNQQRTLFFRDGLVRPQDEDICVSKWGGPHR